MKSQYNVALCVLPKSIMFQSLSAAQKHHVNERPLYQIKLLISWRRNLKNSSHAVLIIGTSYIDENLGNNFPPEDLLWWDHK